LGLRRVTRSLRKDSTSPVPSSWGRGPLPAGRRAEAEKLLNPAAICFNGIVRQPALPGHRLEFFKHFTIRTNTVLILPESTELIALTTGPDAGKLTRVSRCYVALAGRILKGYVLRIPAGWVSALCQLLASASCVVGAVAGSRCGSAARGHRLTEWCAWAARARGCLRFASGPARC
jgi:hypothetical protein